MALIVIAILISTAMNMAMPQISTKTLFDDVLSKVGSTPAQQLLVTLGYLIGAVVGMKLLGLLMTVSFQFLMGSIMPRVIYDIKSDFRRHAATVRRLLFVQTDGFAHGARDKGLQ